jgi:hypothetical protein
MKIADLRVLFTSTVAVVLVIGNVASDISEIYSNPY